MENKITQNRIFNQWFNTLCLLLFIIIEFLYFSTLHDHKQFEII